MYNNIKTAELKHMLENHATYFDMDRVFDLISQGADIKTKGHEHWDVMRVVLQNGKNFYADNRHEMKNLNLRRLMMLGADIHSIDSKGQNLFMFAIKLDFKFAMFLFDKGADANLVDKNNENFIDLIMYEFSQVYPEQFSNMFEKTEKIIRRMLNKNENVERFHASFQNHNYKKDVEQYLTEFFIKYEKEALSQIKQKKEQTKIKTL